MAIDQMGSTSSSQPKEGKILRQFADSEGSQGGFKSVLLPAVILVLIIAAGALTGYFLSGRSGSSGPKMIAGGGKEAVSSPEEMGLKDEEAFPDRAEGRIEVNEDENTPEGSHLLIRPHGESQTAHLTSSVVDLNQFVGKCVEVWGQTFASQKVSWLMDIGYIKKLDKCPEGIE